MQKRNKLLVLAFASLLLTGCGNTPEEKSHEHTYSGEWSFSNTEHFRKCTVNGCEEKTDKANHDYNDWVVTTPVTATEEGIKVRTCKVCNYEDQQYISTDEYHEHSFTNKYAYDDTNHWKVCDSTNCGEKDDSSVAAHSFGTTNNWGWGFGGNTGGNDGWETVKSPSATEEGLEERKCNTCAYKESRKIDKIHEHTFDNTSWSKDSSGHWHPATCEHTSEKGGEEGHNYSEWNVTKEATATDAGSKERTCSTCGYKDTAVIPAKGVTSESFTITTNLTETKEIHTSEQKTYLSYTGDYATMDPSKYPDGNQLKSDSLPVSLAWNFTPASGKTVKNYTVTFGQKSDLEDGFEVVGTTSKSIDIVNPFLGTNYFKINAYYTDNSKESSDIKTFKVSEVAPRNLAVGGMTNCRDMGGRTTNTGAKVKQGLIYRTSGNKFDYSTNITDGGKKMMLEQLGIKTEINVADGTSYDVKLNGTKTYDCFMDYAKTNNVSKHHFSRNAESVKNVFKILADERNYPVYYHCRIGTDRTGLVGNLVYGLLGVPLNMIYQDYLFSNFGKIGEKRYIGSKAGQDDISIYMNEIQSMPGANFQEKTYNTLLSIGVEKATLDKVISILTDGTKNDNNQGQIAVNVNNMTLANTSAVYTSRSSITDRKEPEYYVKLSSGASASYKITTTGTGTAKIYGYLGHNSYDSSKKISDSVKVSVDGVDITVPSTTFADAGMGNIDNRTNYYFVSLGEKANLAAGEHTITITGKANDMKLGTLSVFGVNATASSSTGGSTGGNTGGNTGSETGGNTGSGSTTGTPIKFMVSESSGYNNSGEKMKSDAVWAVDSSKLPAGNYKVSIEFKLGESNGHEGKTLMDGNTPYYTLYVGSTAYEPTDKTSTRGTLGISYSSFNNIDYVTSLNVPNGTTQIKLSYTGSGYSMKVNSVTFTPIA